MKEDYLMEPHNKERDVRGDIVDVEDAILSAVKSANHGLTEDAIKVVIALRHRRALDLTLEQLILKGEIDAELRPNVPGTKAISVGDFIFFAVSAHTHREKDETGADDEAR
jgi:hypothetical protein